MLHVVILQFATLAVFEPFLCGLVATDIELPGFRRYVLEALCVVDPYTAGVSVILIPLPPSWSLIARIERATRVRYA